MAILEACEGFSKGDRVRDKKTGATGTIDYLTNSPKTSAMIDWDSPVESITGQKTSNSKKHLVNIELVNPQTENPLV
jgi:hypothetical protein